LLIQAGLERIITARYEPVEITGAFVTKPTAWVTTPQSGCWLENFFFPFFLKKLTGELNYNPLKANNSRAREGIFKDVKETDRNSLYLPILIAI
jgi:hypothetical protein